VQTYASEESILPPFLQNVCTEQKKNPPLWLWTSFMDGIQCFPLL